MISASILGLFLRSQQSSITNHQPSTINHQSPIINHQTSIINDQPSIIAIARKKEKFMVVCLHTKR